MRQFGHTLSSNWNSNCISCRARRYKKLGVIALNYICLRAESSCKRPKVHCVKGNPVEVAVQRI
jgi:hypothetical protein